MKCALLFRPQSSDINLYRLVVFLMLQRSKEFLYILATSFVCCASVARAQDAEFKTTYTGSLFVTPINTNILLLPHQDLQPVISGSLEWSFVKTDKLGFEFSGGIYPYTDHDEILGRFGIRKFFANATAPVGGYWEMMAIGGATEPRASTDTHPEPEFGLGLRLGSMRTTRFGGSVGFEYGGGPSVMLTGGEVQVRIEFFFGAGWLLGKDVVIER